MTIQVWKCIWLCDECFPYLKDMIFEFRRHYEARMVNAE